MRKFFILAACAAALGGCSQTERGAAVGVAAGTAIGAVATGTVEGAVVGGVLGGAGGAMIGAVSEQPGYCYYRDRRGRTYTDRC